MSKVALEKHNKQRCMRNTIEISIKDKVSQVGVKASSAIKPVEQGERSTPRLVMPTADAWLESSKKAHGFYDAATFPRCGKPANCHEVTEIDIGP